MDVAALIAWLVTATGGFVLFARWLSGGGMTSSAGKRSSRFPPALVLAHAGLAAAGLVVWILYVSADDAAGLGWAALAILGVVAVLGFTMFFRWLGERRNAGTGRELAEQRLPVPVVYAHGAAAVVTVALVLIAALEGSP